MYNGYLAQANQRRLPNRAAVAARAGTATATDDVKNLQSIENIVDILQGTTPVRFGLLFPRQSLEFFCFRHRARPHDNSIYR
jgi:hypothetical protein